MSSDYPKSKFTGIEVKSSIVPAVLPFNTRFIYHNVLNGIPFYPNSFDYIFMRSMVLCFTESQYEQIIKESIDILKPNGYLELCEGEVNFHNMGPISRRIVYSSM
jgi:chemotaxis methyl-accepting protein methylase